MRSGPLLRLAAISGAAVMTGACAGAPESPPTLKAAPVNAVSTPSPVVTATIPEKPPSGDSPAVPRPMADEPVRVPPPKVSKYTYTFPVKGCRTTYARELLMVAKSTIWADRGCAFVSPVDGVVDEVQTVNRWSSSTDRGPDREGLFVTVIGADGVRYLGGHLESVAPGIRPGTKVKAGRQLGRIGNSGNAQSTASNLYFAISWKTSPHYWWIRRGMVKPWDYLDAWRSGNPTLSPREETMALRKSVGATLPCSTLCGRQQQPPAPTPPKKKSKKRTPATPLPLDLGAASHGRH
ncbi:Murein DD-endopeptidase MepM and murein hydrolase activator NlpD, contain LysM domain [Sinosporangium album]|uniref:Murein DD-endopeptidase MepM and murein hydrolase activator NlpD, contain LysM domain n=1 Tax=Sinosporangium album TaxID=504805 RepID=A0A1G7SBF9_9ACTN|nr:M23 family metallopeptidase [Sinosporangium album]SDG19769.1 Murein DD-endopeptidase MepM and murein hydrolase activator NlpD, contain LysM domain [Sinosporangium album]